MCIMPLGFASLEKLQVRNKTHMRGSFFKIPHNRGCNVVQYCTYSEFDTATCSKKN